jgi:FemAB-related protein (PEP-CTERM system-associated)
MDVCREPLRRFAPPDAPRGADILRDVRVERVEDPGKDWDDYVESRPGASLGHAAAWARALREGYGIGTVYLRARDDTGAVRGVLPLAHFRGLSGRRELVSLPFLDAAGLLADDEAAERALLAAARGLGLPFELRQRTPLASVAVGAGSRVDLHLPLGGGPEARWAALPAKVRNQTRKATKQGLALAVPTPDAAGAFHRLHCAGMHALGTPPHAERFLRAVLAAFGERARVLLATDAGRPVAGLVAIRFAGAVTVPWASTLRAEASRCPTQLVYWEALRWAEETGASEFDFGRSPRDSGTWRFNRGWGATERPLYWVRFDRTGAPSVAASSGDSRALQTLGAVWRRLPPRLCAGVGPTLRRRISS